MTTCGGTAFELWTDEMALSITPNPSIYRSDDRRKRAEKKYTSFDDYRMDWEEEIVTRNYVLSDFVTKTAYFSLAAAALVFVSMLMMTGLHP